MSVLPSIIHALYENPISTHIRESEITFPVIQTFHALGIMLMAGTIAVVDLRLLGVILRDRPSAEVAKPLLPLTWIGFVVMVISGGLLFAAQSEKIYGNTFLRIKFLLLIFAGLNVLVFHATTYRSIQRWGAALTTPASAKLAGALSLLVWGGIIITGRFIAYY